MTREAMLLALDALQNVTFYASNTDGSVTMPYKVDGDDTEAKACDKAIRALLQALNSSGVLQ
jgi:hypothetical protein